VAGIARIDPDEFLAFSRRWRTHPGVAAAITLARPGESRFGCRAAFIDRPTSPIFGKRLEWAFQTLNKADWGHRPQSGQAA
jgi:hypothetical protein